MRCIYFNGETCFAFPENKTLAYEPTQEEMKQFCENIEFLTCPRLKAFIEYLKTVNSK